IKGLLDGDGYIDKYKNIVYFTKSEKLAKQLSTLLLSFGIMPTICLSKGYYIRMPYTRMSEEIKEKFGIPPSLKLCYTTDSIYGLPNEGNVKGILINLMNNFGVPYSVKANLINQDRFIDSIREYGIPEKFKEDFKNLKHFENMITLVKIKKIEEVEYEGDVFDLAVPVSNSFIGGNGIVFHNSYGWYIYSVIKYGSMSLAHVSDRLGTPNAKFLGLTISDIDKFGLKDFTIKAEEVDIKRAKEMLNYEWFKHPAWQKELKLMIERKIKAELEALSGKGLKFITETYLPEKIEKKDFLP
ncbi:MAG: LAGLIDADG family homing endonuclease, partial [Candidatus Aenigmatarchaeota archaeon]